MSIIPKYWGEQFTKFKVIDAQEFQFIDDDLTEPYAPVLYPYQTGMREVIIAFNQLMTQATNGEPKTVAIHYYTTIIHVEQR